MNKEKSYTPKLIAESSLQFTIPLYQRLFAWTPKEVKKLLFDLQEHFDSKRFKEQHNPYYLGMLTAIRRNNRFDLIDGQQRFTIIMLIAIAFSKINKDSDWKNFIQEGRRLKLDARSEDEAYLNQISLGTISKGYVNVRMNEALDSIINFLQETFRESEDSMFDYMDNVYNYLTFFISELPDHYLKDPASLNKYFEVMNSTGKGLEQHEILKVDLVHNNPNSDLLIQIWDVVSQIERPIINRRDEDSDISYAQKYKEALFACRKGVFSKVFEIIRKDAIDVNEQASTIDIIQMKKKPIQKYEYLEEKEDGIISFPEFLLLTLDLTLDCNGRDSFYQKDKLIERFSAFKEKLDIEQFYNNLLFYRLLLDYYVVRKDISNGQSRFFINHKEEGEDTAHRACLRQYLSMLTVSSEFYIWLKPYMRYLMSIKDDNIQSIDLLNVLKTNDDLYHSEDEAKKLRILKYPNIDRYWFWRLDYYLWERNKSFFKNLDDQKAVDAYVFRANRSIEHLHPQDESYNDMWDNNITNGFGNLAMISQSFNSLQSNDNIRVKFARIQEQLDNKSLQSIKMLHMFRMAHEDHSKWNEKLAKEHLNLMCDVIESSYHRQ